MSWEPTDRFQIRPIQPDEVVLLAEQAGRGTHRMVAAGRLRTPPAGTESELDIAMAEGWQRGVIEEMVRRLIAVAQSMGRERVFAMVPPQDLELSHVLEGLGFELRFLASHGLVRADLCLGGDVASDELQPGPLCATY